MEPKDWNKKTVEQKTVEQKTEDPKDSGTKIQWNQKSGIKRFWIHKTLDPKGIRYKSGSKRLLDPKYTRPKDSETIDKGIW